MDDSENAHIFKALSTPARRQVLELIQRDGPMDLKRLTAASGMKETTLRHHLLVLERAGLVTSQEGHEGVPGRPPLVYHVPKKHHELGFPKRQYALLSEHLLEALVKTSGRETAAQILRDMGREVAERLLADIAAIKGSDTFEISDIEDHLIPILDELGSAATLVEVSDRAISIRMNNCIYFELAQTNNDIICEGHNALFNTIGQKLGGFRVEPQRCMAHGEGCCLTKLVRHGPGEAPE